MMPSRILTTWQVIMHILNLSEIYVVLSSAYAWMRSPALLAILLPSEDHITSMAQQLRVTPIFIAGTMLCSFGALLRLVCYRHLGQYFTLELALLKDHKLITDGPYKYVRHPSYLGIISFAFGLLMCQFGTGSWWAEGHLWSRTWGKVLGAVWLTYVAFVVVSVIFIRVQKEDKVLKKTFGDQWVMWSKTTPYRLLPGVY